jgi:excisionase family DNA binding protein
MTLGQVAEALQVSLTAARAWCREGKIPGFKMGAVWRVPKAHLIGMMGGRHD